MNCIASNDYEIAETLEAKIEQLEMELATLREDKSRLDWLETIHWSDFPWLNFCASTCISRESIDAAMSEAIR